MLNLNKIPLLRLLVPFILGIVMAVYLILSLKYLLIFLIISILCYISFIFIPSINSNYKFRWIFGVLLYVIFLLFGATLTAINFKNTSSNPVAKSTEDALMIGEIIEVPKLSEKSIKIVLQLKGIRQKNYWEVTQGKIVAYLQKDSLSKKLSIGDIISLEPKIENVPAPKNPNEFDYRKYLSYHLIHQQAFLRSNNWFLVQKAPTQSIYKIAHKTRNNLINILKNKGLKNKELAVASALILGYKDDIDAQLKSSYSNAGAMHILAVSGLHVGIIFLICNYLFFFLEKLKYGNLLKGILIIIILWCYALITGLSPSVLRAATMFSFVTAAKTLNRNSSFFNTLASSALVLLLINPLLIMEVGFQLSYLAVVGIVIIQPWINNLLSFNNWLLRKIWEITAVSIAAQIATFPLGLLYFHQFPNYFLFANLIVIPLAIIILSIGIATLCLNFIPVLSDWLSIGLNYLIKTLNYSVSQINNLPYSLTENIKFTITDTWLLYFAITTIILLIAYRKFKYLFFASLSIIVLLCLNISFQIKTHQQHQFIVYNIPQYSAINLIDGKDNVLFSDIKLTQNKSKMLYHTQNNWIDKGVHSEKIVRLDYLIKKHQLSRLYRIDNPNIFSKRNYLQFYNLKIVIIDKNFEFYPVKNKLVCDFIILSKNTNISLSQIDEMFATKQLILDASNSTYKREKWKEENSSDKVKIWDIVEDGAFVYAF